MSKLNLFILLFIFSLLGIVIYYSQSTPQNLISSFVSEISQTPTLFKKPIDNTITLLFGGDIMLGRSVNTQIQKKGDFGWPMANIKDLTSKADLFMVNLESPFGKNCLPKDSGMVFCADPKSVLTLVTSGVDIVTIANNHINNQQQSGIDITKKILSQNNILYVGESSPSGQIINIKGTKIAILGFNDIPPYSTPINKLTEENLINQIKSMRSKVDLLIFTPHWGNEYSLHSARQEYFAHLAIDNGVDAVIGHHPHWVQEYEEYQGKPIYYSLGNLVFDQMWSEETKRGLLVRLTYNKSNLIKREELPVKIEYFGQPSLIQ